MSPEGIGPDAHDFEISFRFRRTLEARIARLESDAANDESLLPQLLNRDHIRRQMRLVAVQRIEALRMRRFLDQSRIRVPRPTIVL